MKTLIKNCRIVSDGLDIAHGYIAVDNKTITEVGHGTKSGHGYDKIIDARGKLALPGFIDIHIHGSLGHHVGDGKLESIEKIAKWKMEEGVTTFCPSTVTMPDEALLKSLESVRRYKQSERFSKVAGMHLEGPFLNEKKLGGQNPRFIKRPDIRFIDNLLEIYEISIVSFSPELMGAMEFAEQLTGRGIIASCAHSAAGYDKIMECSQYGLSHFTHLCNQMTGIHHRDVGAVGAALLSDMFSAELICDKLHICPEMIQLIFKCKSLTDIMLITDSSYLNGLPDGEHELRGLKTYIKDGIIRLAGTDTLSGSSLRMNVALKNVIDVTGLPIDEVIKTAGLNQARKLGLDNLGKLEKGYIADIVLADDEINIQSVIINGKLVSEKTTQQ